MRENAVRNSDWSTANAIESLPLALSDGIRPEELTKLRRDRMAAEAPQAFQRLEQCEAVVETSTRVIEDAEHYLDSLARDLPPPDPETGTTIDDLGFTVLTPSQASEATADT